MRNYIVLKDVESWYSGILEKFSLTEEQIQEFNKLRERERDKYTWIESAVEFILTHTDYKLVGVCFVGGCKASGYREYHFVR